MESLSVAYACQDACYASFCRERNYHIVARVTPTEQKREGLHVSSRISELLMKRDQRRNLQELTRVVAGHAIYPDAKMLGRRKAFGEHVAVFHNDANIPLSVDYEGIVLMSAHQPNLFPYSGVVRKAVLVHAVAEKLRNELDCPVAELFCFADQDFANERWFREAQLPSVRSRNGTSACACRSLKLTTIRSCGPFQGQTVTK